MSFIIRFREEDAFSFALKDFVKICGFKPGSEKHKKMFDSAMKIREQGADKIDIRILVSAYEADVIHENFLKIANTKIYCDALVQLDKGKINKVLFYILTAGECGCESDEILNRLYADFWGTAYVDASYELLREEFYSRYIKGNQEQFVLSDAFGPGYYGMESKEILNFFEIMDANEIGVKCLPSGVMVPVKSCAGILFVMEKDANMPEEHCKHCTGNRNGCQLCYIKNK